MQADAQAKLASVVESSYGKLLAALVRRWGDLESCQDALAEAFAVAVEKWPTQGVPDHHEGWLLQVARRRLIDGYRRGKRGQELEREAADLEREPDSRLPDERLELLLLCAHPALDIKVRVPLMLNAVLGLSAHKIAAGFAVAPATMSARLLRAKKKIRETGLRFEIQPGKEREARLKSLGESLYLAFSLEADELGDDGNSGEARAELLALARIFAHLDPHNPEALGLLALMLYQSAREPARLDSEGAWVAFESQQTSLWNRELIEEAEQTLLRAHGYDRLGRFQLEAALESAQIHGRLLGLTDWGVILQLYEGLAICSPTLGGSVAHASALLHSGHPEEARLKLASLGEEAVRHFQPYWATLAATCRKLGLPADARLAGERARELARSNAQRNFLSSLEG